MTATIDTLQAEIKHLKTLIEITSSDILPPDEAAIKLRKGVSTIASWRKLQTVNGLGIPFCKGFHWTEISGINLIIPKCQSWIAEDTNQLDEFMAWRKAILRMNKFKIDRAS